MPHFTKEQLQELATVFGLSLDSEILPVRDGYVRKGDAVWWRCNTGPEAVASDDHTHWENIKRYPNSYQLREPKVKPSKFSGYVDD